MLSIWFVERGLYPFYLWLGIESLRADVQCLTTGVAEVFRLMC